MSGPSHPLSSADLVAGAQASVACVGPADAAEWLQRDGFVFVDVRDGTDWAKGRIPTAVNAPRGMLEFYIDPASEFHMPVFRRAGTTFVFYCGSGARAALSALTAKQMGLDVCAIKGGFKAWSAANLPREGDAFVKLEKGQ